VLKLLFLILFITVFMGCSDGENKIIEECNISKNLSLKNSTKEKNETLLNEMGFDFSNQKIIIDINKSSNFFSNIEESIEKNIERKVQEINFTNDLGVLVSEDLIKIDLNKTKGLIDGFSTLIEDITSDINKSIF